MLKNLIQTEEKLDRDKTIFLFLFLMVPDGIGMEFNAVSLVT